MCHDTSDDNPYEPDPRTWEDKHWLYEQYWGRIRSIDEIAQQTSVSSQTIIRQMRALGIPRRAANGPQMDDPHDVALHYSRAYNPLSTAELRCDGNRLDDELTWANMSD